MSAGLQDSEADLILFWNFWCKYINSVIATIMCFADSNKDMERNVCDEDNLFFNHFKLPLYI